MNKQVVFVGGDVDLISLATSQHVSALLATGRVGFYSQDDAIQDAYRSGSLPSIVAGVAGTGPGEAEINVQHGAYNLSWFQSWFQSAWLGEGLAPQSVNAIVDYSSSTWVQDFQAFVQAANSFGITSVAPIFSPNEGIYSLAPFATNPAYADLRAAALMGGGLTIDAPPSYFFLRGQEYENFIYGEIQWAHANNLRATVIISPNYSDTTFAYQTQAFVKLLQWNNATPSEWVVENYTPDDPNGIGSETNPNSIAGVALWVAQNALTTNSAATAPPPTPTISVGALGTVREAVVGGGVNVTVSVQTTFLAGPIYWGVTTAQGNVESPQFFAVNLDADGTGTITAHLAHSGDTITVTSSLADAVTTVNSAPVTITEPAYSISPAALGTVQEATVGAGVTVSETIRTSNVVGSVYWGVLTAQGNVESPQFYAAALDANGTAVITAHLAHSGDYVAVETSLVGAAVLTASAPVTITEPAYSISPAALGTVQEAAVGAGVTVSETIRTSNVVGSVYWGVLTAQGNVESPQFYAAALDANGTAVITAHLAHSGDYVAVETSLVGAAVLTASAPVTITEPAYSISPAALGTVQEATVGAGVTVSETIRTSNVVGSVYWGVLTAQGNVESPQFYAAALDANGTAVITAHLAHSGDYVAVETSLVGAAVLTASAPVTITEPAYSISPAALGTVQEAAVGAGVTVSETIRTSNVVGSVYWGVLTAQGNVESPQFYAAALDANGTAVITAHLAHSGDYVAVETSLVGAAVLTASAPVTITEPAYSISPAALGTVQEAAVGAGVTVSETIRTSNVVGSVYWGVLTAQGNVESPQFYAAALDTNGTAVITAHLAHSGDYVAVETSLVGAAMLTASAPVTITEPAYSISPAALGTVQEAAVGAGVTVSETIRTSNVVGSVYWGVLTAQGNVESPQFYAAALDANGTAVITAHLAHSGDYVAVETSLVGAAMLTASAPVTITEPAYSISPAALGTVQEAAVGAGVTVSETIRTSNVVGSVYWGVLTAQGNVESPQFYAAALDANGTAVITAHLAHSGDYVAVETSLVGAAVLTASAPVTITEPAATIIGLNLNAVGAANLAANPDFSATWYASQYQIAAGLTPLQDYLTTGWLAGRNPDPWFDTNYYLAHNPDVKASGMNPLIHYELYGWREGRDPSLLFSTGKYLAAAPDVAAAGLDPLQHYLAHGQTEGRAVFLTGGSAPEDPLVNAAFYDAQLGASLIPGGVAGAQQATSSYSTTGWQAGLKPDALFDTKYYLSHYPDVAAAHINPLLHYETYGWKEGRDPSAQFSTTKYLAAYSDVKAAGMDPLLHYVAYGAAEGRSIFAV